MAEILSQQQLKSLSKHKYSSEGTSITEPALQILWRWMVEQIPLWVAPNLITIVGLIINVGTSLLLMYYSPDAKTQVCILVISHTEEPRNSAFQGTS